ncbi:MAG: tyrosine-type recombinase/integrase [Terriglobia bacterium]|nr:tyrosine-type recombinase/integrase [Terriglobia bacterium]
MNSAENTSSRGDAEYAEATIRDLLPLFLAYAEYEWNLSPRTIRNYREALLRLLQAVGDIKPVDFDVKTVLKLKTDLATSHVGVCWTRAIVNALRSFLRFCKLVLNFDVLDPKAIRLPAIPRREVVFLTPGEIEVFLNAIPVRKQDHRFNVRWLCFRALVEVLLSTGMRISEALSLDRSSVIYDTGEARVIGKGRKERTVFFTPRAIGWIKEYLSRRSDSSNRLFALPNGEPLEYDTVRVWFNRIRRKTGIKKPLTAHIMRHTCATLLLFNGCSIAHIKEILGHDRLETTCRYYLGVDKAASKEAHRHYLNF